MNSSKEGKGDSEWCSDFYVGCSGRGEEVIRIAEGRGLPVRLRGWSVFCSESG